MTNPLFNKVKTILSPKTHLAIKATEATRLFHNKYSYRVTLRVLNSFAFQNFRRAKFKQDYSIENCIYTITKMVEFRRETLAKFAFPLEGRDKEDRYDDINETAVLFRYCLPEKVSSFQSRLHVYFKNEADLLTFLGGLPDYFKERVIEIVYPPAGVTLRPGVLRFKKVKGFKYLIVSYWSRWTKQDAKLMLNIADTTDCTMGKSTQMRLMELLNDGTRDTAYLDHVRIRVPDEKTLSWIQLHSGRKWKIYEIEEIQ